MERISLKMHRTRLRSSFKPRILRQLQSTSGFSPALRLCHPWIIRGSALVTVFTIVELLPRPTKLPGDLRQWLETFAQPFSNAIAESARTDFLDEICQHSRLTLQDPEGNWTLDYVRLRFATCKD